MPVRPHLLAACVALGPAACTSVPVARTAAATQPALTAQTLNSGGVMPAEQARVHFDHAELHFAVDPATQSIDASATLSFTAKSATGPASPVTPSLASWYGSWHRASSCSRCSSRPRCGRTAGRSSRPAAPAVL